MLEDFRTKFKRWFGFPNYLDVNTFIEDIDIEKSQIKKAPAKKAPAKKTAVKKK